MPALVNELVQQKVDVILASNNGVIRAAKAATKTIPIVMVSSVDPVAAGYVDSFAHAGGNVTGIASLTRELSAKRLELLKEALPKLSRVAILWDADGPGPKVAFKEYEDAGRALKLKVQSLPVRRPEPDLNGAFQAAKKERADGLIVVANPLITPYRKQALELATKNRLPSMNEDTQYVELQLLGWTPAASCHTDRTSALAIAAPPPMWTKFSKARSRLTYRLKRRQNLNSSSI
jgi:putative ABC transport system substrate-binding protein